MSVSTRFFTWNRRLCHRLQHFLPHAVEHPIASFGGIVAQRAAARPGQRILDVGGGKTAAFEPNRDAGDFLIAMDVSAQELSRNQAVDAQVVGDASRGLPFADGSVDLVVSRAVIEHLDDPGRFVLESARVLRAGGSCVHVFPTRWAPFAIINRAIPNAVARALLRMLQKDSPYFPKDNCGFHAYYRDCTYSRMRAHLERAGFEVVETRLGWFQSYYFDFFLPLYLLSVAYELAIRALGLRDLCPYVLLVAERRPPRA